MSGPNRVSAGVAARPTHRVVALADVLVALSAAAGLAATYYLAVRTRTGQVLDTRAMDLTAQALLGAHWTETLLALISPATVSLAITALGVLAWAFKGATAAVEATCTAVGTILAAIVLKAVLERPMFFDTGANSLPSGHVAAVAGVAAAVALLTSRAARPIVIATGAGAVALTGVATLALGWHRPSDVLASALVAIGVARTTRWTVAVCGR
jgi:membrane-associated phospholipid phosphatase